MNRLVLLSFFLLFSVAPAALAPPAVTGEIQWIAQFGTLGPSVTDGGEAIVADEDVYVGGMVGGAATFPGEVSAGSADAFLRKYDSSGDEVWTRQFGSLGWDAVYALAIDSTGIYAAGGAGGALPGQTSAGDSDAFLRKYDRSGNAIWTAQFGTAGKDEALAVAAASGALYVTGRWTDAAFVAKYAADGTQLWMQQITNVSPGTVRAYGIAVHDTAVYVTGETWGTLPGVVSAGGVDAFIRKYDVDGNELWTDQFGTTSSETAYGVTADADGVYVVGDTLGALPGQSNAGSRDAFVRRYDAEGSAQWTRQFGNTSLDSARAITRDDTGLYVAARGIPTRLYKFDRDGAVLWTGALPIIDVNDVSVDAAGIYVIGSTVYQPDRDVYVRSFDLNGTTLWSRYFTSYSSSVDVAQAVDAEGAVVVVGRTSGVLWGQPGPLPSPVAAFVRRYSPDGYPQWTRQFTDVDATYALAVAVDSTGVYVAGGTSHSYFYLTHDAFVRKFDVNGNLLWTRVFGSATDNDFVLGMSAWDGELYVAGTTAGTLPGQVSAGGTDAFLRKYDAQGVEIWTRQFGSAAYDEAAAVCAERDGAYVGGNTSGDLPDQANAGGADAYLRRYDAQGVARWTRQFGTPWAEGITAVASDGASAYVTGHTYGTLPGQLSAGNVAAPHRFDGFVRKFSATGHDLWTDQFGTTATDHAQGIAVDFTGVYVTGDTSGTLTDQASAGRSDAYVRKYSFGGNALWTRQFGTTGDDSALGIATARFAPRGPTPSERCTACTDAAALYVVGTTTGFFSADVPLDENAFVIKMVEVWSNR